MKKKTMKKASQRKSRRMLCRGCFDRFFPELIVGGKCASCRRGSYV